MRFKLIFFSVLLMMISLTNCSVEETVSSDDSTNVNSNTNDETVVNTETDTDTETNTSTSDSTSTNDAVDEVDTDLATIDPEYLRSTKEWSDVRIPLEIGKQLLDGIYSSYQRVSTEWYEYKPKSTYNDSSEAELDAADTTIKYHNIDVVSNLNTVTLTQANRARRTGSATYTLTMGDNSIEYDGHARNYVPHTNENYVYRGGLIGDDISVFLPFNDFYLSKDVYNFPNKVYRKTISTEGTTMWVFDNVDGKHIYAINENYTSLLTDTLDMTTKDPLIDETQGTDAHTLRATTDKYFNTVINNVYDTITYSIVCDTGHLAMEYGLNEQLQIFGKIGLLMVSMDNKGKIGNWYASFTYTNDLTPSEVFSKTIKLVINTNDRGYLYINDNGSISEYNVTIKDNEVVSYSGNVLFTYKMYGGDGENSRNLLKIEESNLLGPDEYDPFIKEGNIFW